MDRFAQLLSQLSAEHERLRRECEVLRADAEAWRAERPHCHKAVSLATMGSDIEGTPDAASHSSPTMEGSTSPPTRDSSKGSTGSRSALALPIGARSRAHTAHDAGGASAALASPNATRKPERSATVAVAVASGSRASSPKFLDAQQAEPDDERSEERKPSLTFATASQGQKRRCLSKARAQGQAPEFKLWPLWEAQDSDDSGIEALKLLAHNSSRNAVKNMASTLQVGHHHIKILLSSGCLQALVMAPSSRPRIAWDVLSSAVLGYDILAVPVFALVAEDAEDMLWCRVIFLVATTFWTVDMIVSFFSGFHINGVLEMRPSRIASRYLRGWFLLDFPVVVLDWSASALLHGNLVEVVSILRVNKVARFIRVLRVIRLLRMVKLPRWADSISDSLRSETVLTGMGILRSLLIVSVASHYIACFWYFIGNMENESTWIADLGKDSCDIPYGYVTALHWSLTQFTPASMEVVPRNTPERVFTIFVILSAMVTFSMFVSSITQAMAGLQRSHAERDRQQGAMRSFLDENRISLELGGQISRFARTQNMLARGRVKEGDVQIFRLLPESLRQELHWEVYAPVLSLHPLFVATLDLDDGFVQEACHTAMSEVSLSRYEELFHPGQEASRAYFMRSGTWEYRRHWEDAETMEISGHKCVCEVALWLQWEIQGVLMAVTTCEAASLSASKFHGIVSSRPCLFLALREYASGYKARLSEGSSNMGEVGLLPEILQGIVEDAMHVSEQWVSEIAASQSSKGIIGSMSRVPTGSSRSSRRSRMLMHQRRTERL